MPPTAPVKVTVPAPAAIVNARPAALPLSVPPKLTLLLVVESVIGVADRVTLPLYSCAPVVVMLPFSVIPVAWLVVRVSEDKTLEPPTTPPKLMAPEPAFKVKSLEEAPPLRVLLNVMLLFVEPM